MPWCPNCKEEYTEGIEICPDCNTPLVESLELLKDEFRLYCAFENEELADKFLSYLNYSGIEAQKRPSEDGAGVYIRERDFKKAKKHFSAFYSVEAENAFRDELKELQENNDKKVFDPEKWAEEDTLDTSGVLTVDSFKTANEELNETFDEMDTSEPYEKRSDKASDMFSTAVLFLAFGVVGLIVVLLNVLGIFNFMSGALFYILASAMFIGFVVVGITSFVSYKKLKEEASQEEEVTKALLEWLKESFTETELNEIKEDMEKRNPDYTEEELYYIVNGRMKAMLNSQFGELDESYADYITEEYYNSNFAGSVKEND